ncbi:MAG: peptidoglycan/LPS O-acetylase OafA/YrhL [Verrucomicrobiales bacterium]|jgi:peptidoglycan/LPS O-acetylase OafA/YrhL
MKPIELRRLASVDACRGAAALSVLVFHVLIWVFRPGENLSLFGGQLRDQLLTHGRWEGASSLTFGLGFLGVQLFFVISGFCIHAAYVNRDKLDRLQYFLRRLVRIYPLYLLVVISLFILYAFVGSYEAEGGITLRNFIGHLFFWHYEAPASSQGRGISEVLWTIALEVQFYIIYALVGFSLIKRFGVGKIAMVWLGVDVAYRLFWYSAGSNLGWHIALSPERMALFRFGEWMLGAWLADQVFGRGWDFVRGGLKPVIDLTIGGAVILAGVLIGGLFKVEGDIMDVPGAIGFFFVIRGLVRSEFRGTLWTGKLQAALGYMGDRCYTLYLTHLTVVAVVAGVLQRLANRYDWVHWPDFGRASVLGSLFAIVAAILISLPIYRFIERPSHHLARRLCPSKKPTSTDAREIVEGKVA